MQSAGPKGVPLAGIVRAWYNILLHREGTMGWSFTKNATRRDVIEYWTGRPGEAFPAALGEKRVAGSR